MHPPIITTTTCHSCFPWTLTEIKKKKKSTTDFNVFFCIIFYFCMFFVFYWLVTKVTICTQSPVRFCFSGQMLLWYCLHTVIWDKSFLSVMHSWTMVGTVLDLNRDLNYFSPCADVLLHERGQQGKIKVMVVLVFDQLVSDWLTFHVPWVNSEFGETELYLD